MILYSSSLFTPVIQPLLRPLMTAMYTPCHAPFCIYLIRIVAACPSSLFSNPYAQV